jgi:uncharacterized protein
MILRVYDSSELTLIMAKKILLKIMPDIDKLQKKRGFSFLGQWLLKHPYLFHVQRHKVALGFALGIGFGVIPLPVQVFFSLFFCFIFRANVAASLLAAVFYNPLTYPFIFALALQIGTFLGGHAFSLMLLPQTSLFFDNPEQWFQTMMNLMGQIGETLLLGVPVAGLLLGLVSYWLIRASWYWAVVWQYHQRKKKRHHRSNTTLASFVPATFTRDELDPALCMCQPYTIAEQAEQEEIEDKTTT